MPAARKPSPIDVYRTHLQQLSDWDDYLRQESRLPGPRANLELIEAVIQAGDGSRFAHLLALDSSFLGGAPPNTPDEFLTVCAVAGLGKLVAEGDRAWLSVLRRRAADPRWRVREAVAIALQHWGDHDMLGLVDAMQNWSSGSWLEQRAVVAALAEPRLLRTAAYIDPTADVIPIFDTITECIVAAARRRPPRPRLPGPAPGASLCLECPRRRQPSHLPPRLRALAPPSRVHPRQRPALAHPPKSQKEPAPRARRQPGRTHGRLASPQTSRGPARSPGHPPNDSQPQERL